ncbi:hypothetical protein F5884DRAFT_749288 [Xylogone sp. PMI_703]|nr:hypothetical protein F5884DRAFT_749288 [Xylogone sp. PMI_703]
MTSRSPRRSNKKSTVPIGQVPLVRVLCELLGFQRASVRDTQSFLETMHAWRKSSVTSDGEKIGNMLNWRDPRVQTELAAMSTRFLESDNAQRFWSPDRSWWQEGDLRFPEDKVRIEELLTQLFWRQNKYAHMNTQYGHRITELKEPKSTSVDVAPSSHSQSSIPAPTTSTTKPSTPQTTTPATTRAAAPEFLPIAGPGGVPIPLPLPLPLPAAAVAASRSSGATNDLPAADQPVHAQAQARAESNLPGPSSDGPASSPPPARSQSEPNDIVELSDDSDDAEPSDSTSWQPRRARRPSGNNKHRRKRSLNKPEPLLRRTQRKRAKHWDPEYATHKEIDEFLRDDSSDDGEQQPHASAPTAAGKEFHDALPQESSVNGPFVAPTAPMIAGENSKPNPKSQSAAQKTSPSSKKSAKIVKLRVKPPIPSRRPRQPLTTHPRWAPSSRTGNTDTTSPSLPSVAGVSPTTSRINTSQPTQSFATPPLTGTSEQSSPSNTRSNNSNINGPASASTTTTQTLQQDAVDQPPSRETTAAPITIGARPDSHVLHPLTRDSLINNSSRVELIRRMQDRQARDEMSETLDNFLASKPSESRSTSSPVVPQTGDDLFSSSFRSTQRDLDARSSTSTTTSSLPSFPRLQTQPPSHAHSVTGIELAASPSPIVQPHVSQAPSPATSTPTANPPKPRPMAPITFWIVTYNPKRMQKHWENGRILNSTSSEFFDGIAQVTKCDNFSRVTLTLSTPTSATEFTMRRDDEASWNLGKKFVVDGLKKAMREMRDKEMSAVDVSDFEILIEPVFEQVAGVKGNAEDDYQAMIDFFGLQ